MNRQLAHYVGLLKYWWWLLIVSAVVPFLISGVLLSRQPNFYLAKATLVVGNTLQNPEPDQWQLNLANSLANAYARLVEEGPLLQAVTSRLGLEQSTDQLAEQITTRVYPEAQLLEIAVVDTHPQAAALIANALADELIRRSPVSQEEQAQRQTFISNQLDDLETRIAFVQQEIDELQTSIVELTSAAELQEAQDRLAQLEAVNTDLQSTYASLLTSYQSETPNVISLFEAASAPLNPLPRRDKLIMVVAAVAGLALAVGGILLIEFLDNSVQWEGEARHTLLGMPVLGAIARISTARGPMGKMIDPLSPSAEMVRALRTNIFLAADDHPLKSLLLTSATLDDGKTFAVAQLGLTVVASGKRVIMIDADLRKPALHEMFDLPNARGLSELLANSNPIPTSGWPPGVQATSVENLYLLPAGRPPIDPSLLLTSHRLGELIEMLNHQVDLIIVDSPPYLVAPDAGVLAAAVDGTVLVIGANKTSCNKIAQVQKQLNEASEVNLLGVAFNRVKMNGDHSYYHYYHDRRQRRKNDLWQRWFARLPFLNTEPAGDDQETILTLAEMADYMGIGRAMARRWCKSGRVPARKSWLQWRVKEQDLAALISQATDSPTSERPNR